MKKAALALLMALTLPAFAQTYDYMGSSTCGNQTSPVYCNAHAVNANGTDTVTLWTSWGTSAPAPAVGQTLPLTIIWLDRYIGAEYVTSAWYPGDSDGSICHGTVTNTGVGPAPYTITGSCSNLVFSDGSVHVARFTQSLLIYTVARTGRKYWELVSGSITLQ